MKDEEKQLYWYLETPMGTSPTFSTINALFEEIKMFLDEGEEGEITIVPTKMTPEEYSKLPEFQGY